MRQFRTFGFVTFCLIMIYSSHSFGQIEQYRWKTKMTHGAPDGRHENAFVEFNGKFYLIGGRGVNPVNVYHPKTNRWKKKSKIPMEIHHFQAVVHGDIIYIVGGMTGRYPKEKPLEHVWMYNPKADVWEKGAAIPKNRQRGGAGAAVYNDKIYLAGGIKLGHTSGTTNYFDCFDPKTNTWETLTDAPHIRDHYSAIVHDNKLYCIGGRNTSVHYPKNFGAFFGATVPHIDYYDFKLQKWFTMKNPLPGPTAAGSVVKLNNDLIYFGGESNQKLAHNQTQCLDLETGNWKLVSPMVVGRHGTGAILYKDAIYIAAGSEKRGGGKLTSMEVFSMK